MFILGESTIQAGSTHTFTECGMIGEAEELATMAHELAENTSQTMLAMARVESQAVREQASAGVLSESTQTLIEEAKEGFFKRIVDFIKEYWNKFVDYIKKAIERVKNFLSSQNTFVRRNQQALNAISDSDLSVKFDRTQAIADPSLLTKVAGGISSASEAAIARAQKDTEAQFKKLNFEREVSRAVGFRMSGNDSMSKQLREHLVGVKDKGTDMKADDVKNALSVLQGASAVDAGLKSAQTIATGAIRVAESQAAMGNKAEGAAKKQEAKEVLNNLRTISPKIGGVFSTAVSATAAAASNAKAVLSRALANAGSGKGVSEEGAGEGEEGGEEGKAVTEDALSRFMV